MPREVALALLLWLRGKRDNATEWAAALAALRRLVRVAREPIDGATPLQAGGDPPVQDRAALGAFGLTAAEVAVVLALAEGLTPDEIARQRGTSRHTVRNQIKSTLSKTGARRQAELTALVARLRR